LSGEQVKPKWEIHHRNVRRAENAGVCPTPRPLNKGKNALGPVISSEKLLLCGCCFNLFFARAVEIVEKYLF
jgi:hypothetical protein